MTEAAPTRIAVIGLGNMGEPMAGRWLAAGYEVRGCDVSEQARARLAAAGGIVHEAAPPAVEGASVVVLMLPNSAVVNDVIAGIRTRLAPGASVIDMSSSEPAQTRENARALGEAGVALMDAPVSGGVRGPHRRAVRDRPGDHPQRVQRIQRAQRIERGQVAEVHPPRQLRLRVRGAADAQGRRHSRPARARDRPAEHAGGRRGVPVVAGRR
jgi:hypothetical protein